MGAEYLNQLIFIIFIFAFETLIIDFNRSNRLKKTPPHFLPVLRGYSTRGSSLLCQSYNVVIIIRNTMLFYNKGLTETCI